MIYQNLTQLFKINKDFDVPHGVDKEEVIETEANNTNVLKPESALFNKPGEQEVDFDNTSVENKEDGTVVLPREPGKEDASNNDTNVIINPELQSELAESLGSRIELHFNNDDQTLTITEIRPESDQTEGTYFCQI